MRRNTWQFQKGEFPAHAAINEGPILKLSLRPRQYALIASNRKRPIGSVKIADIMREWKSFNQKNKTGINFQ